MFEGNRIDSCMVSESPIDIFVDNHVASTMVAKNFVQSSPTNKIAINDFLQNGLTCQPCKIDDVMETTKVLRSIDKMLSRIPLEDLTLPRVPVNKFSATSSLSFQGIAQHLVSLRTGYIARLARPIVQKLMLHPKNANIFNAPVDPIALDIPSYFQVIKSPMDLGTIKSRLQCGHYSSINQCFEDVRLVFSNAMTFNVPDHYVHRVAKELLVEFEEEVKSLEEKCARDMERKSNHKCGLCSGSLCVLCGEKCLKFETPTLFCHAATCGQRIKKHSVFFISPDGTLIWCQKCYVNLPSVLNEGMEGVPALPKRSLLKRRFDEEIAEPWVECDKCGSWCHQLCALYTDVGTKNSTLFNCPMCILNSGKMPAVVSPLSSVSIGDYPSSPTGKACLEEADMDLPIEMADAGKNFTAVSNFAPNVWRAESLPRTHLSDFLEAAVKDLLVQLGQEDIVDTICIRMTSNYDNLFEVPNSIRENFQTSDGTTVSSHMAFRQKCIQLFQTIDGVDVCLFCLYVHEFDASCPPPNQSSVYIAYLDSVDYFRPSHVRTFVYQEIVVAYLKWAQVRGFKQCHLWSCPPQRGDNFIFWCHPSHQRTPSRDRLNSWYHAILHRSECLKISKGVDKFWNLYFSGYQVNRREEGPCRQAAKNSFVGTGKVSNNKGKGLPPLPSKAKLEGTKSVQQQSGAVGPLVCPPLFDGDYWMLEFVRLHAALMNKDPMAGGPQSLAHYRWCKDQIKNLYSKPIAAAFRQPVDPVALNIPRYPQVIKNPMDLGTIREKLRLSQYGTILSFVEVSYCLE